MLLKLFETQEKNINIYQVFHNYVIYLQMMFPQHTVQFPNLLCLTLVVISFVFCVELSPHCTNALPLLPGGSNDVEFKRYCSTNLSDAIRLICGGRYYSLSRKFRKYIEKHKFL